MAHVAEMSLSSRFTNPGRNKIFFVYSYKDMYISVPIPFSAENVGFWLRFDFGRFVGRVARGRRADTASAPDPARPKRADGDGAYADFATEPATGEPPSQASL